MPISSPVAGAVAGVVALAGLVGFAVGLPELSGDGSSGTSETSATDRDEVPALPEAIGEGFVASDTRGAEGDQVLELDRSAEATLEDLYDTDVAVREYGRDDPQAVVAVTVLAGEPGLFAPGGPPFDPALSGLERSSRELVEIGDAVCSVVWQQPIPLGQEPVEGEEPSQVECQQGSDGLTFDLIGLGVSADEAVALLEDVIARTTG